MDFIEEELIALFDFSSLDQVLIDVGAHQGGISTLFARKGWRVIAFEPEQTNRAEFQRKHAEFPKVTCLPNAVLDVSGRKLPFYVSDEHWGIHSLKPFHETHRLAYEVETVRLDETLEKMQIPGVTVLKIDAEGADFLALKGFDFEKYHPEVVMIEFMDDRSQPHFGYNHHEVCAYMKQRGYMTFVSAWSPIVSYGRQGVAGESSSWLGCRPYPLDYEPSWGNLIFVAEEDSQKLMDTIEHYVRQIKTSHLIGKISDVVRKIPGGGYLIQTIKGLLRINAINLLSKQI
jgi:FkbM family methyltransferase